VAGFDTEVFPFTTDIPFLDKWGAPLLMGPGSIFLAHTAGEYVELKELEEAVGKYESLALSLRDGTKGQGPKAKG
jgi:acetylornithine deacetylase